MIRFRTPRQQRGVSLIEVMVAIVIFGVGMLGLALLQMKGAQFTKESSSRTNALLQADSLADAMRANPQAIAPANGSSSYYLYSGAAAPSSSGCPDAACRRAKQDLSEWLAGLKNGGVSAIGSPSATVSEDSQLGTFTVLVSWNGVDTNGDKQLTSADNGTYSFSFLP